MGLSVHQTCCATTPQVPSFAQVCTVYDEGKQENEKILLGTWILGSLHLFPESTTPSATSIAVAVVTVVGGVAVMALIVSFYRRWGFCFSPHLWFKH